MKNEIIVASVPRARKEYQRFNQFELAFIQKRTKDAPEGKQMSARQLAQLPEMRRHTKESIATRIKKHHFAPKEHNRVTSVKRFTKKDKRIVLRFLRNEGRFWPSACVAKRFGYSHKQIVRLRFFWELQIEHSDRAMKDPVYKKWYETREKKRIKLLQKAFRERPKKRQQDLEAKLEKLIEAGVNVRKTQVCDGCNKRRPRTVDFFRSHARMSANGKRYLVLTRICLACPVR